MELDYLEKNSVESFLQKEPSNNLGECRGRVVGHNLVIIRVLGKLIRIKLMRS